MSPLDRFLMWLAGVLDGLKPMVPPAYELNVVLIHKRDVNGTIIIGQTDAARLSAGVEAACDNPASKSGRVTADGGVSIEGGDE